MAVEAARFLKTHSTLIPDTISIEDDSVQASRSLHPSAAVLPATAPPSPNRTDSAWSELVTIITRTSEPVREEKAP